ncbi:hypothetical protein [Paracoccus sp. KR1-242]|uniref:hypothetical protein n=1 Tax=Paracoccus sp. KR1-242 TaxID=3410028 RepID=UPI003C07C5BF
MTSQIAIVDGREVEIKVIEDRIIRNMVNQRRRIARFTCEDLDFTMKHGSGIFSISRLADHDGEFFNLDLIPKEEN